MKSAPIYSLRLQEVYSTLETSPSGLTQEEAEARLSLYGPNVLSSLPREPLWRKLVIHITHPMALLLWIAGIVSWGAGDPVLGVIIWIVVLVNGAFSFWQEYRAGQATALLETLLPNFARALRGGVEVKIPATEIVAGDLLVLAEGDHIPADARVIEEYGLRVNNSTLTGEAVPARKTADASLREDISEVERPNLVFAGTTVVSGTGRAVVYATGMLTQFGRITRLTQAIREEPSLIQKELLRVTRIISLVALGIGVLVFVFGIIDVQLRVSEAFLLAIGVIVAAIPEGLPATVSLALAMAVQRLAQRGVLVKKYSMVDTLGTVSVICTDKSGTLTQNQMTVRQAWVSGQTFTISGVGYEPVGAISPDPEITPHEADMQFMLTAATLCNNSRLSPPSLDHPYWTCLGDQTEAALQVAALKGGLSDERLKLDYPRLHEIPFDARRKRMSTVHRVAHPGPSSPDIGIGQQIAFVKGAPREVVSLCTHILVRGEAVPLDQILRNEILSANDQYASNALRVLALACRELSPRPGGYSIERVESGLTFLGLMAMHDPPRPEIEQAVKTCRQAGIRMVMITGDYGLTAESLARRVGMLSTSNPTILTGAELDQLNDLALQNLLEKEVVYARMAPEHKLRLVAAYQARGEVVAVTGDGVNDAPALRKADVGVAMGLTGTDVAKEAADIILMNDNFATIVTAIQEGRAVYENIRKFVTYIFSSNVPEILPFLLSALTRIPLALNVKQILAIDLGTDIFPALALGGEKPEPDVMLRPPRKRSQPLVDRRLLFRAFLWLGLIEALLCYFGFFFVYDWSADPFWRQFPLTAWMDFERLALIRYPLAVTVFYAGVVMAQVGNAFACRTDRNRGRSLGWVSNPRLLLGIGIDLAILLVLVYFPPIARLFGHVPIPASFWIGLSLFPLVVYGLDWIRKWVLRVRGNSIHTLHNGKEVL